MTLREFYEKWLVDRGMFPADASTVLDRVRATKDTEAVRWSDPVGDPPGNPEAAGYPTQLLALLLVIVQQSALEWIEDNCPLAWYKPMISEEKGEA